MSVLHYLERLKKQIGRRYWDVYSKAEFFRSLPENPRVLDVGCGNDSPAYYKRMRPDCYYVGLDIGDYKQSVDPGKIANEYILTSPEGFAATIESLPSVFDAVVSTHNIEHCNEPERTLDAMLHALRPGGRLLLIFPSEASVRFPRRRQTLNFHDDPTHVWMPRFDDICKRVRDAGFRLDVTVRRNRPLRNALRGLLMEPLNAWRRLASLDTWALYGFESIIWATRIG